MSQRRTIKVHEDTWIRLNKRKRPGDSFDDVISAMLEKRQEENPPQ